MCSSLLGQLLTNQSYLKRKTKKDLKINIQRNIFKLFYLPVSASVVTSKKLNFFNNPLCSAFFIKESAINSMRLFSLFYELGHANKRIIFMALKKELVTVSTLLTYLVFSDRQVNAFFKLYYILTKKNVKTRRKKLKKILRRFRAHSIFFLSLPKSKKFIKHVQRLNLLTIGLTNTGTFDLNIPIVNN